MACLDQCLEKLQGLFILPPHDLRMPLYAQKEGMRRAFNRLNNPIGCKSRGYHARCDLCHSLVMEGIHVDGFSLYNSMKKRILTQRYAMRRIFPLHLLTMRQDGLAEIISQILIQHTTQTHIHRLNTAANGENGLIMALVQHGHQRQLAVVTVGGDAAAYGPGLLAVATGVNVIAAGEYKAVAQFNHRFKRVTLSGNRKKYGHRACSQEHIVEIAVHRNTGFFIVQGRSNANQRPFTHEFRPFHGNI